MKNIKAVLFDMDGVLVDACDWHRDALNEALTQVCNYKISKEDHQKKYNGLPTIVKLKKLNERGIIHEKDFEKIQNLKQSKTVEVIKKKAVFDETKVKMMQFLKDKDIKIACFTNSIRATAELALKKIGVFDYLDLLVTNQDVENCKPNPEGYLLCCERLKINKDNAIIVEDSDKGIQAAKSSGIKYIRVKNALDVNLKLLEDVI